MNHVFVFTEDELAALRDFFPRITIANVVQVGTPLHTALAKLSPGSLPTSVRNPVPSGCVGDPGAADCPHGCFYRCEG